ncbi:MAG: acyl carrier protein [Nitrospira sp.]|nr:acyl carrier protein [Nitrospira sp.]MBS0168283.1 acyl carrier protein [Nitrospira sp.]
MTERIDPAITEKIVHALATYLKRDPASITESHHLRDDLGLDSVAVIELLFEIEERFKLQIPDQDLPGLSTVGSVAAYVQRRLAEPPSTPQSEAPIPAAKPAKAAPKKPVSKKTSSTKATSKKPSSAKSVSAKPKPLAAKKPKVALSSKTKKKGTTR